MAESIHLETKDGRTLYIHSLDHAESFKRFLTTDAWERAKEHFGYEEDDSIAEVQSSKVRSPSPETLVVEYTVENIVKSGSGEDIYWEVTIEVDGETVEFVNHNLSPGEVQTGSVELADVSPGRRKVCVY